MLADVKLIRYIVPFVAVLDILIIVRSFLFLWYFVILPRANTKFVINTSAMSGIIEHKFPILSFK